MRSAPAKTRQGAEPHSICCAGQATHPAPALPMNLKSEFRIPQARTRVWGLRPSGIKFLSVVRASEFGFALQRFNARTLSVNSPFCGSMLPAGSRRLHSRHVAPPAPPGRQTPDVICHVPPTCLAHPAHDRPAAIVEVFLELRGEGPRLRRKVQATHRAR